MTPDADAPTFEPLKKANWGKSSHQFECGDKKQYKSRSEAKSAVRGLKLSGEYMHEYLCLWCRFFHVGHIHI